MILPPEINRFRDLATTNADAIIDACRTRVLVVTRVPEATYTTDPANLVYAQFSDGQGFSGLARGDMLRGHIFGAYTSFRAGIDAALQLQLVIASTPICQIGLTVPDQAGIYSSFRVSWNLRLSGGENATINSPAKNSNATMHGDLAVTIGDTATSIYSVSQLVSINAVTVTDPSSAPDIALNAPLGVSVRYTPDTDTELQIYGGVMEGL